MEAIQNYDSDLSNSDNEDLPYENVSEILKTSKIPNETQLNNLSQRTVTKLNCDFFNLQDSESDDESQLNIKQRKIDKVEILSRQGETVSLPDTDFWEPVKSELKETNGENPAIKPNAHSFFYNYTECRSSYKATSYKTKNSGNLFKTKDLVKKSNSTFDTNQIKLKDSGVQFTSQNKTVGTSSVVTKKDSEEAICLCNNSNNSTRKLYENHGKISPWLKRSDSMFCKLPRQCEKSLKAHEGSITRLKWNISDFSHLLLTVSMDTKVKIWNVWTSLDPCVRVLQIHHKGVTDCDWSNSGKQILTTSYDKNAIVSDVETGKTVSKCVHRNYVTCGKYHPTDEHIFLTGSFDELTAWDTRQSNNPIHVYNYKDKIGQIQDVIFNRDGSEFFSTGDLISRDSADRNIMAWDFNHTVVKSNQIYQERYSCTRLKLHPQDSYFLAQSHGNYIAAFSSIKPYKMCKNIRYEGHKLGGYKIGFDITPDGRYIISGDSSGNIYSYDYQSRRLLKTLSTKLDINIDIAFHPVLPSTLACCGWNGFIEIWH